ncbi:MAG TPA: CorA family divalent cation transporter [Sulfuricurvum sp.]|nr:CorA family divalent cation transporter [Sulfuricurvum sp.]
MNTHEVELHDLHLQDLQNPLHPSSFEEHSNYTILILRLPEHVSNKPKMYSYGFIITEHSIYSYNQDEAELKEFKNGFDDFYRFLDAKIDILLHDFDKVQEKIVTLEESLYKKITYKFMDHWHVYKKELSRSERIIVKAVDVMVQLIARSKSSARFPLNEFNDLHEHLERALRSNISANEQLDHLYQYYNLRSNDRMNRSIYILTVISVIFLPLNLVVGFFGMNTGGLPFQNSINGTAYAFTSMIIFATVLTISVFWKIKNE